jgi:hypothetical protein
VEPHTPKWLKITNAYKRKSVHMGNCEEIKQDPNFQQTTKPHGFRNFAGGI